MRYAVCGSPAEYRKAGEQPEGLDVPLLADNWWCPMEKSTCVPRGVNTIRYKQNQMDKSELEAGR